MNPRYFWKNLKVRRSADADTGLLRARARGRRRVVGERAGGAARCAGGLRPLECDRREGLGLEFGAAVFPPPGDRPGFHRPTAWRAGPHHRSPHADGAVGRFHPVRHESLERARLPAASRHERRVRRGLFAAAAFQRRQRAAFHGGGISGRGDAAAAEPANSRRDAGAADPVRERPRQRRGGTTQRRDRDDHRRQCRGLRRRAAHAVAADAVGHRTGGSICASTASRCCWIGPASAAI